MLRPGFGDIADEPLKARPRIGFKFDALLLSLGGGFHGE